MTADALPAGAPTPTDETANRLAELEQLLRDMFGVEDELAKAEARIAELETELAGLRSRQTRDEDGQRIAELERALAERDGQLLAARPGLNWYNAPENT